MSKIENLKNMVFFALCQFEIIDKESVKENISINTEKRLVITYSNEEDYLELLVDLEYSEEFGWNCYFRLKKIPYQGFPALNIMMKHLETIKECVEYEIW